jgi:pimeloyl-ACP methyl ester carboxylesterase
MPYANNNGVKIYYEVEGEGPPLILAHAMTGSLNSWRRDGYVNALKNDYQLILFDARGHGQSDKLRVASAYDVNLMVDDVTTLLDYIGLKKAHYFGYSLGARVGYWLATHHPDRFLSFILAGNTPYSNPEGIVKGLQFIEGQQKLRLSDPEEYLQRIQIQLGRPMTDQERNVLLSRDPEAVISIINSFLNWPFLSDSELGTISLPCFVFCGDLDESGSYAGAKKSAEHIPNAKFLSCTGLGHIQAQTKIDLVLPHIKEFLAQVSKK